MGFHREMSSAIDTAFCLYAVLTVPEVVFMWKKTRKTVDYAILAGKLESRRTGHHGVILVTRSSVAHLWGAPLREFE